MNSISKSNAVSCSKLGNPSNHSSYNSYLLVENRLKHDKNRQQELSAVSLQLSVQLPWGINTGSNKNTFPKYFARHKMQITLFVYLFLLLWYLLSSHNILKHKINLNNINTIRFYHTENTLHLHYKYQSVSTVHGNNRWIFWESHEIHNYNTWENAEFFSNVKTDGTYSDQYALNDYNSKTLHSAHTVYLCVPYGSHNK
jgi:hypothetical protein